MKFRRIMRLWIIVLIFFASATISADDCISIIPWKAEGGVAADTDFLTISPSGDAGPRIYEITISGTRDSDTATVMSYEADIYQSKMVCEEGVIPCNRQDLTVKAVIGRGENSGSSTYQQKFKIFLDQGTYALSFLLPAEGDNYGLIRMPPDNVLCRDSCGCKFYLFSVAAKPPVSISLQNATAEISGTDSFTLRNLAAETDRGKGIEKFNVWGTFQWNPSSWSWEIRDGGIQ